MTAQVHERIVIDGQERSMSFCPPLPLGHPRLREKSHEEISRAMIKRLVGDRATGNESPDEIEALLTQYHSNPDAFKRTGSDQDDEASLLSSTACWRGYEGTWAIKGDRFYLVGVRGRYSLIGDAPLLADWFTGEIRVSEGKMLAYVHQGFGSASEREIYTKIENGIVVTSRVIDTLQAELDKHPALVRLCGSRDPAVVCKRLSEDAAFFVELIVWASAHPDSAWHGSADSLGNRCVKWLLGKWTDGPGHRQDGPFDARALIAWLEEAQRLLALCDEQVRRNAEFLIGSILADVPCGTDGLWPHEAVRELVERGSAKLLKGFELQLYSDCWDEMASADLHELSSLASHYDAQADAIEIEYPRIAAALRSHADSYSMQEVIRRTTLREN